MLSFDYNDHQNAINSTFPNVDVEFETSYIVGVNNFSLLGVIVYKVLSEDVYMAVKCLYTEHEIEVLEDGQIDLEGFETFLEVEGKIKEIYKTAYQVL